MSDTPDLEVCGLTKSFETADGTLEILTGAEFSMQRGDAIAVTGPSGSGKSTLLYILGLLDTPSNGSVKILGQDPFSLTEADQAAFRNANIGFIFQDHHLLPQCTVLENVVLPALAGKGVDAAIEQRARELLGRVGLTERVSHRPAQISGGERQRVAVCRALIHQPTLMLADEPTGNLDPKTADAVGSLLLELCEEQNTILVCVTHSMAFAERFPKRLVLSEGQLVSA